MVYVKRNKIALSIFLSAVLFCLPMTSADALGSVLSCPEQGRLAVSGGRLAAQAPLQSLVEEYFDLREMAFSETTISADAVQATASCLSAAVQANEQARRPMIASMEARGNLQCHGAESVPLVENAQILGNGDVQLSVYEWIWVDYTMEGFDTIDRMGYGVEHEIIARPAGGSYLIVSDEYDEGTVTGMTTDARLRSERLAKAETSISRESVRLTAEEQSRGIPTIDVSPEGTAVASAGGISGYYPARAIDYANSYVARNIHNAGGEIFYNSKYGYFPGADCCNYVSQCLHEGGISMDSSWKCNLNPSNITNPSCTAAWSSVSYFRAYFKSTRGCQEIVINGNNYDQILPGNPVYVSGSNYGHITLCVGYNSAGVPIVNAHTNDVYHVPYTLGVDTSKTVYTMKITTTNTFSRGPQSVKYDFGTIDGNRTSNSDLNFGNGNVDFYRFKVTETIKYKIYSSSSKPAVGILYRESQNVANGTMYMYELSRNNLDGANTNFSITYTLSPGTYYVSVRFYELTATGYYFLYLQKL